MPYKGCHTWSGTYNYYCSYCNLQTSSQKSKYIARAAIKAQNINLTVNSTSYAPP